METNSAIQYISKKLINMRIFFQWHCYEKKLRYVQINFSSSNSSFEVVDNVLKILIRGVNKNSLSASSLYFISPK